MGVDNPENYSVPNNVLIALANMSDHLPVTLKLAINQTPLIGIEKNPFSLQNIQPQTWSNNELFFETNFNDLLNINIYNVMGQKVFSTRAYSVQPVFSVITPNFSKGVYLIKIENSSYQSIFKIMKN